MASVGNQRARFRNICATNEPARNNSCRFAALCVVYSTRRRRSGGDGLASSPLHQRTRRHANKRVVLRYARPAGCHWCRSADEGTSMGVASGLEPVMKFAGRNAAIPDKTWRTKSSPSRRKPSCGRRDRAPSRPRAPEDHDDVVRHGGSKGARPTALGLRQSAPRLMRFALRGCQPLADRKGIRRKVNDLFVSMVSRCYIRATLKREV